MSSAVGVALVGGVTVSSAAGMCMALDSTALAAAAPNCGDAAAPSLLTAAGPATPRRVANAGDEALTAPAATAAAAAPGDAERLMALAAACACSCAYVALRKLRSHLVRALMKYCVSTMLSSGSALNVHRSHVIARSTTSPVWR